MGAQLQTSPAASPVAWRRPIHVVHVFGTLMPGGAERQAVSLFRRSDRTRFRHSAINYWPKENDIAAEIEAAGCPLHLLDKTTLSTPRFFWGLRRLLRRLEPDVVHTWLYSPAFWGRAAAVSVGMRGIVASTRTARRYRHGYERVLDRWLSRRTAVRITNSQQIRRVLMEDVGLSTETIEVIYNGVEESRFADMPDRAAARARLGWPAAAPILLSIGRVVEAKNYPMLLRVVERIGPVFPGLRAYIAGWGDLIDSLRKQRDDYGLKDCLELLGRREDVAELMAAADVFVMTSAWEGFPNALLEAMWVGLPVVSTRVSGTEELIESGTNGVLVDVDDDRVMSDAVAGLLRNPAERARLGAAARRSVRDRFSIERMVAAHEAVYERVARPAAGCPAAEAGARR